jgi:hypothetical protein
MAHFCRKQNNMSGIGKRLMYFLIGVTLGTLVVFYMVQQRTDIRCNYLPNSRVLNDLRQKNLLYSDVAACQKACLQLDTNDVHLIFAAGAVIFDESQPRKKPCGEYKIVVRLPDEREISALAQNCDSTVTLLSLVHEGTECGCD